MEARNSRDACPSSFIIVMVKTALASAVCGSRARERMIFCGGALSAASVHPLFCRRVICAGDGSGIEKASPNASRAVMVKTAPMVSPDGSGVTFSAGIPQIGFKWASAKEHRAPRSYINARIS